MKDAWIALENVSILEWQSSKRIHCNLKMLSIESEYLQMTEAICRTEF
jgi:hypothetical protein